LLLACSTPAAILTSSGYGKMTVQTNQLKGKKTLNQFRVPFEFGKLLVNVKRRIFILAQLVTFLQFCQKT